MSDSSEEEEENLLHTYLRSLALDARKERSLEAVKAFVAAGFNVDAKNENNQTALHLAARIGEHEILQFLLQQSTDVNARDKQGSTALHMYLKLLVLRGSNETGLKTARMYMATKDKKTLVWKYEIPNFLFDHSVDIYDLKEYTNDELRTYLQLLEEKYAKHSSLDTIRMLVDKGVKVDINNEFGQTALHVAARVGEFEILQFLTRKSVKVNERDQNKNNVLHVYLQELIFDSAKERGLETVHMLVAKGAEVNIANVKGETALDLAKRLAVIVESDEILHLMMQHSVDVNSRDKHGNNVLQKYLKDPVAIGVKKRSLEIVRILVSKGTEIDTANEDGETALHLAAKIEEENHEILYFLMQHSTNVNARDNDDKTVLHVYLQFQPTRYSTERSLEVVKMLVRKGVKVKPKNKAGETAMHLAARIKENEILHFLIKRARDVSTRDVHGNTVLLEYLFVLKMGYPKEKSIEILKLLVAKGADVNGKNKAGITALQIAAEFGDHDILKLLIQHITDINMRGTNGSGVLHSYLQNPIEERIKEKNVEVVKMLVDSGADINSNNSSGETAMHVAAKIGELEILQFLMQRSDDVKPRDKLGNSVLHAYLQGLIIRCAKDANLETVQMLVAKGLNVDAIVKGGKSAIHIAAEVGKFDILQFLMQHATDTDARDGNGNNALLMYFRGLIEREANEESLEVVKLLVSKGVKVDATNAKGEGVMDLAMYLTAQIGEYDTVHFLMQQSIDVNKHDKYGNTVLHDYLQVMVARGVKRKSLEIVRMLVAKGADVDSANADGETAAHTAVEIGEHEILKFLIHHLTDVNVRNKYEDSVLHKYLHFLVEKGTKKTSFDIVKMLIAKGAEVDTFNKEGETAIDLAMHLDDYEILQFLIEHSTNINARDKYGNSMLYTYLQVLIAKGVKEKSLEIVSMLVAKGAKVNTTNVQGETAMHLAAELGDYEIVQFLLPHATNVKVRDRLGNSVLHTHLNSLIKGGVEEMSLKIVKIIVAKGVELDCTNGKGKTPVDLAKEIGDYEILKFLRQCSGELDQLPTVVYINHK